MWSDLRFAARALRRQPVVSITAVLLLGLGIGASTMLFSAMDALMLQPLPVRQPQDLVRFVRTRPVIGTRSDFDYAFLRAARERLRTVHDVFAWAPFDVAMTSGGPPERIRVHVTTGNYFEALGVRAALGRAIEPGDDQPSKAAVAVLSDGFWRRRFGADPAVLGRAITLAGHSFVVIGVTAARFNGVSIETSPEVRVPLAAVPLLTGKELGNPEVYLSLEVAARLRPGVAREESRDEVAGLYRAVLDADKSAGAQVERELNIKIDAEVISHGISRLRAQFGTALTALMAGTALLMVMVCANVAGLLVARSAARRAEWTVRLAVGASRWRLGRLMLAESTVLAAAGIALGLMIALVAVPLLVSAIPPIRDPAATSLPLALQLHLDWRALAFASAAGLIAAVAAGIAPAWSAGREDLYSALRSSRVTRGAGGRSILVAVQVALCTLLVAGAAVFVQTFRGLRNLDPGFDARHVATFGVDPELASYTREQRRNLEQRLLAGVRTLPGVESAGIANRGLMRGTGFKTTVVRVGEKPTPADFMNASLNQVSPEYFETMGIRFLAGRNFREGEIAPKGEPQPAIVNRAFVERFFPSEDPIGRRFGTDGHAVIIGVVSDAKYRSLREPLHPTIYNVWVPGSSGFILHVRTRMAPESIIGSVTWVLAGIDPRLPFFEITTLAEEVDRSIWQERLVAWMSLGFALLAVLVAGTGMHGLMSYMVSERSREIGIRSALGARPGQIVRLVAQRPGVLTLIGAAAGLVAAAFAVRTLRPLLFGVTGLGWPAGLEIGLAIVCLGLLASAAPAARAARVDPATTLRDQ